VKKREKGAEGMNVNASGVFFHQPPVPTIAIDPVIDPLVCFFTGCWRITLVRHVVMLN